jgi:histidinol-phosphate phosphatase family protein
MKRAAFLDRDGVINQRPPAGEYITRWEDLHILPGVAEAVSGLREAGFLVVVVTNQRAVARGLLADSELQSLHQRMRDALEKAGAKIDALYYCPHEKEPACECRKPAPGMLLKAASEYGIDLSASWMIGDSLIDMAAGKAAGCKTALIGDGETPGADLIVPSLLDAARLILKVAQA